MDPSAFSDLPELLAEIAEVAGLEAALALGEAKGGTRVHFPIRAPDGHWLVGIVGRTAADALCRHFNAGDKGIELYVPLGPRRLYGRLRRRAVQMREAGVSVSKTAIALGVTERTVHKWHAAHRGDPRQGRLFS